jgi:hypothetical protein
MNKKPKEPTDVHLIARRIVEQATGQPLMPPEPAPQPKPEKNPAAVALGRLGGLKGGRSRAEKLTPERRAEIAKKASSARWHPKS